ncbi:hypothetical protein CEUSTIGMA_g8842.t1 [Chlamydomonas eustigma]|uniref:EF-hand domain-containing protein n=1 Tax=Chlamydomonas eustigma TaxID=1157962 RepID=A0A250XER7_9CHLO|nr:hypothetical protein CEUSTIGMA_g8842.t1 [Chlamydomonas eustigma]|eukprot:GAX81412.1 hypothetical protein CEUSTIGMA_g8842.t1 [Chlamydomonas eustigma]
MLATQTRGTLVEINQSETQRRQQIAARSSLPDFSYNIEDRSIFWNALDADNPLYQCLSGSQLQLVEESWDFMSEEQGKISFSKLVDVADDVLGKGTYSLRELRAALDQVDTNKDGMLDQAQFKLFMVQALKSPQSSPMLTIMRPGSTKMQASESCTAHHDPPQMMAAATPLEVPSASHNSLLTFHAVEPVSGIEFPTCAISCPSFPADMMEQMNPDDEDEEEFHVNPTQWRSKAAFKKELDSHVPSFSWITVSASGKSLTLFEIIKLYRINCIKRRFIYQKDAGESFIGGASPKAARTPRVVSFSPAVTVLHGNEGSTAGGSFKPLTSILSLIPIENHESSVLQSMRPSSFDEGSTTHMRSSCLIARRSADAAADLSSPRLHKGGAASAALPGAGRSKSSVTVDPGSPAHTAAASAEYCPKAISADQTEKGLLSHTVLKNAKKLVSFGRLATPPLSVSNKVVPYYCAADNKANDAVISTSLLVKSPAAASGLLTTDKQDASGAFRKKDVGGESTCSASSSQQRSSDRAGSFSLALLRLNEQEDAPYQSMLLARNTHKEMMTLATMARRAHSEDSRSSAKVRRSSCPVSVPEASYSTLTDRQMIASDFCTHSRSLASEPVEQLPQSCTISTSTPPPVPHVVRHKSSRRHSASSQILNRIPPTVYEQGSLLPTSSTASSEGHRNTLSARRASIGAPLPAGTRGRTLTRSSASSTNRGSGQPAAIIMHRRESTVWPTSPCLASAALAEEQHALLKGSSVPYSSVDEVGFEYLACSHADLITTTSADDSYDHTDLCTGVMVNNPRPGSSILTSTTGSATSSKMTVQQQESSPFSTHHTPATMEWLQSMMTQQKAADDKDAAPETKIGAAGSRTLQTGGRLGSFSMITAPTSAVDTAVISSVTPTLDVVSDAMRTPSLLDRMPSHTHGSMISNIMAARTKSMRVTRKEALDFGRPSSSSSTSNTKTTVMNAGMDGSRTSNGSRNSSGPARLSSSHNNNNPETVISSNIKRQQMAAGVKIALVSQYCNSVKSAVSTAQNAVNSILERLKQHVGGS